MCSNVFDVKTSPENVSWIMSKRAEGTGAPTASVYLLNGQTWRKAFKNNNIYVNDGSGWGRGTQQT
jgi:hypothetical protein